MTRRVQKLKYLIFFGISVISGFYTFKIFVKKKKKIEFNPLFIVLNSLILMIIWFFSFTGNHAFIQENFYSLLILPLTLVFVNNIVVSYVMNSLNWQMIHFMTAAGVLVFSSHGASICKFRLNNQNGDRISRPKPFTS